MIGFDGVSLFLIKLFIVYVRQMATASGPCGNNRDYLFLLEKAMFNIGEAISDF